MIIPTPNGDITLKHPPVEELVTLRAMLPYGFVGLKSDENGVLYGIVMKCDDQEVLGLKMQPMEETKEAGDTRMKINHILIAETLAAYLEEGFGGVMMPCAYSRGKGEKGVESGISYFVFPDPEGIETQDHSISPPYDKPFGGGATVMIFRFIEHLKRTVERTKLPFFQPIGLEIRPRLLLGSLLFRFLVCGKKVFYIAEEVHESDPSWTILRTAGITEVYNFPSVPFALESKDLKIAKGE
ncbi:MAG: hypothetical protein VCA18_06290 [Opitutales bacterium]